MFRILLLLALMFFLGYGIFSFLARYFGRAMGQNDQNRQRKQQNNKQSQPESDKHFTKDVGEYVSYEEIKDDDKK